MKALFTGELRWRDVLGYYLDANVDVGLTPLLASADVLFTDVYSQGQQDEKSDIRILARARTLGVALVTLDRDFIEIDRLVASTPGLSHAGIIFIEGRKFKRGPLGVGHELIHLAQKYEGAPFFLGNYVFRL